MATTAASTLFASPSQNKTRILLLSVSYPWSSNNTLLRFSSSVKSLPIPCIFQGWRRRKRLLSISAALAQDEEESAIATAASTVEEEEEEEEKDGASDHRDKPTPCQLYVCNLPSSCDASQLEQIFKPFGNVLSAQITRNPETGLSRGSGYVTMSSVNEAKTAVSNLDASLREFFSQFGTVLSVEVLYDTKGHNHRTFAFVSFSYSKELKDAIYSNGTDFLGRKILVRKAIADNTSAVNHRWSKFYSIQSFFPRLYKWNTLVNPPAIEDPVSRFS